RGRGTGHVLRSRIRRRQPLRQRQLHAHRSPPLSLSSTLTRVGPPVRHLTTCPPGVSDDDGSRSHPGTPVVETASARADPDGCGLPREPPRARAPGVPDGRAGGRAGGPARDPPANDTGGPPAAP